MQQKHRGNKNGARRAVNWARLVCALVAVFALLGMVAGVVSPVQAQTYRFQVLKSTTDLYVNSDGTVSLDYVYQFKNNADPIDAVDIGMPTSDYVLSSVTAQVNGKRVTDIVDSPYVQPGIAVNLHNLAIASGQTGTVQVHIGTVQNLLFKATSKEKEPYGSFHFNPNYFGSDFVSGKTDMTVTIHLPQGVTADEGRYFQPGKWPGNADPDQTGMDSQERVFYTWHSTDASSSAVYDFGGAFPARVVPAGVLVTQTPFNLKLNSGTICTGLFILGILGFIILTVYLSIQGDRKRKLQYLPPKIALEGNGIKRGLTAVEAAVLMEQPMDKITTMILFSTLQKGAATVISKNPVKVQVTVPPVEGLQSYETQFLEAMKLDPGPKQRALLQTMMTDDLVKSVSEKMRGFSRKETVAYYQDIMKRAWQQIETAQTPEMTTQAFDQNLGWTMLDRSFNDRSREVLGSRPMVMPMWWGRFDSGFGGGVHPSAGPSMSTSQNNAPTGMNLPTLPGADLAANMVNGMQSFAGGVIGDLTAFTGGITNKTNPPPPPQPRSSTWRGGGGGAGPSCACACACAGCACACAGGGR